MSSETKRIHKLPDDVEIIEETEIQVPVINRGTGAGGANTNVNGLSYEEKTELSCLYTECVQEKKEKARKIKFAGFDGELINVNKSALHKYMTKIGEKNTDLQPAAGCKEPDEAYVDITRKAVYIIEKKFQQTPGSVDEKLESDIPIFWGNDTEYKKNIIDFICFQT